MVCAPDVPAALLESAAVTQLYLRKQKLIDCMRAPNAQPCPQV